MILQFLRKTYDTDYYRDMEELQKLLRSLEKDNMELNKKALAALFQPPNANTN